MAETVTTTLGATAYTARHQLVSTTTFNVDTNLYIRSGPGTGYPLTARRLHPAGAWWTIAEHYNGWCREPSMNEWSADWFISNPHVMDPTPGEWRIGSLTVTVTRNNPWDKNITVEYNWSWNNAAGTSEDYYAWRIYCYAAKIGGGEEQADICNRLVGIGPGNADTRYAAYTVEETSGNTSVTPGNYGVWYQGNGTYRSIDGGVGSQLTFNIPKYNPAQVPTCTATSVSNIGTKTASLSGTFNNNNAEIDKYQFRYKKIGDANWTTLSETTSNSASLTNLTPNTKYEVSARAHNSVGWGEYGGNTTFWTSPLANKPTLACTARASTTATLVLTKNSTNYPDINLYDVQYKKSTSTNWTNPADKSNGTFSLTGLTPNTTYHGRGRTRTSTGGAGTTDWSDYSDTLTFYTKPSAGSASASCVRNNTTNSLNIKVNTSGTYTPAANTYQIRYKLSTATNYTEMTASTNQTQTISGLTANSTYNIQVRARTAVGVDGSSTAWSSWSSVISVRVVKTAEIEEAVFISNTTNSVTVRVDHTNYYPNVNRIYYALVPATTGSIPADPGRITNMYVTTSSTSTTIKITKDYNGNALQINKSYKLFIRTNQYKTTSEWYTAGLDLVSSPVEMYVATTVNVGTLSNVSCVRNNTYNSLTIRADKAGNWTVYKGWQYRYKKSSETNYSLWSQESGSNNKTISNLNPGETYNIQIRGTTGEVSDVGTYYSQIYNLTVKVAKRPTMKLTINSITTNKVKITAKIIDKGYPEMNSIVWNYSSNSYITLTYTPGTYVQAGTSGVNSSTVNVTYEYTLYKQARYNFKVEARQYKAGSEWYTAGIDNKTAYIIEDKELSLYSGRTDRLRASQNGTLKLVDKIYHSPDGSTWAYDGQRKNSTNSKSSMQWVYCSNYNNLYMANPNWFYKDGQPHGGDSEVKSNFNTFIPIVDNVRKDISTAYGGNLLPNKLDIDFTNMSKTPELKLGYGSDSDLNAKDYFDTKLSKNAISLKLKRERTDIGQYVDMFSIHGFSKLINMNIVDTFYIEYNSNIIPKNSDNLTLGSMYVKYISVENPSSKYGEFVSIHNNKPRTLLVIPVRKMLDINYRFDRLQCYAVNDSAWPGCGYDIRNIGSIINFSNFSFYYTTL